MLEKALRDGVQQQEAIDVEALKTLCWREGCERRPANACAGEGAALGRCEQEAIEVNEWTILCWSERCGQQQAIEVDVWTSLCWKEHCEGI